MTPQCDLRLSRLVAETASQTSLFERIAAGDGSAVRQCMDEYGGLVWSLARRFSSSAADAEDASQEIFLELWKSAARYDPAMGSERHSLRPLRGDVSLTA